MIGVFDSLITYIKAYTPPLSPAPSPSTSSIKITLFLIFFPSWAFINGLN